MINHLKGFSSKVPFRINPFTKRHPLQAVRDHGYRMGFAKFLQAQADPRTAPIKVKQGEDSMLPVHQWFETLATNAEKDRALAEGYTPRPTPQKL